MLVAHVEHEDGGGEEEGHEQLGPSDVLVPVGLEHEDGHQHGEELRGPDQHLQEVGQLERGLDRALVAQHDEKAGEAFDGTSSCGPG